MKRNTRTSPNTLDIHVTVASRAWTHKLRTAAACARRAAAAAFDGAADRPSCRTGVHDITEISVLLTTDNAMRRLNALYRGIDKPTNVLSFPAVSSDGTSAPPPDAPVLLGDVAIAYGTTNREARAEDKTLAAHLSHLVVHGVLHLLGYDHHCDRDAMKMEKLETNILGGLGIADPYAWVPKGQTAARELRFQPRKNPARTRARA